MYKAEPRVVTLSPVSDFHEMSSVSQSGLTRSHKVVKSGPNSDDRRVKFIARCEQRVRSNRSAIMNAARQSGKSVNDIFHDIMHQEASATGFAASAATTFAVDYLHGSNIAHRGVGTGEAGYNGKAGFWITDDETIEFLQRMQHALYYEEQPDDVKSLADRQQGLEDDEMDYYGES